MTTAGLRQEVENVLAGPVRRTCKIALSDGRAAVRVADSLDRHILGD
jgi:hypothetical protein